jgi:hypothetical protein
LIISEFLDALSISIFQIKRENNLMAREKIIFFLVLVIIKKLINYIIVTPKKLLLVMMLFFIKLKFKHETMMMLNKIFMWI